MKPSIFLKIYRTVMFYRLSIIFTDMYTLWFDESERLVKDKLTYTDSGDATHHSGRYILVPKMFSTELCCQDIILQSSINQQKNILWICRWRFFVHGVNLNVNLLGLSSSSNIISSSIFFIMRTRISFFQSRVL